MKALLRLLALAAVSPAALAHPGHGEESLWGALTHFLEWEHLLPAAGLVAVLAVGRWWVRRSRR